MATFFGEVRPISSRAYDEEDDDDDIPELSYSVRVELTEKGNNFSKAEALLISYGSLATEFCERLVGGDGSEDAGKIYVELGKHRDDVDTGDFHARPSTPARLFVTAGTFAVCCVSSDVVPLVAVQFIRKVLGLVGASCPTVVLSSHHYGALKGCYSPQDKEHCVMHSLCSPGYTHSPVYSRLPQPAILDSVPAAVLTESLVSGRPCVLYPAFTETFSTGELDMVAEAFVKVFQSQPLQKFQSCLKPLKSHNLVHRPRHDFDRYT